MMKRVSIWYDGPHSTPKKKKKKKSLRLEAEAAVHTCHLSLLSTKQALLTSTHPLENYYERG